ncbi:hypothetical protein T10_4323 [Trichinella papuae]|uniref:Uncharacterized protein n=1 Tax=Trichinella papuae TaxID=268474 RepID=A0A0V1M6T2_9BILA|nr:hypothetical protein T10_4323 [Trichinella papuae]
MNKKRFQLAPPMMMAVCCDGCGQSVGGQSIGFSAGSLVNGYAITARQTETYSNCLSRHFWIDESGKRLLTRQSRLNVCENTRLPELHFHQCCIISKAPCRLLTAESADCYRCLPKTRHFGLSSALLTQLYPASKLGDSSELLVRPMRCRVFFEWVKKKIRKGQLLLSVSPFSIANRCLITATLMHSIAKLMFSRTLEPMRVALGVKIFFN